MRRSLTIFSLFVIIAGIVFAAPRIKIVTQYVTPEMQKSSTFTADSTVYNGLATVPKGTYAYLRAWNYGDSGSISSATWSFVSKPGGSNATITPVTGLSWWAKFKADSTGTYVVSVSCVTSTGTKDTTKTLYSATYVGVGDYDGLPAVFPNCMTCHSSMSKFQDIFNRWKVSGHATKFKRDITTGSSTYSTACFKCHTLGTDQTIFALNDGFDDRARDLSWNWANYSPPKPSNWDTLRNRFPTLVQFATIGCENCHGPGSEHAYSGGDTNKIQKSVNEGVCGKCHDSMTKHYIFTQWKNAKHSNSVYSSSHAQQNNGTNNLGNCIRCHDGNGYVNFTKGIGTNTNTYNISKKEHITCATCHDPHGNSNPSYIRNRPINSDTLGNGFHYSNVGTGVVCLDCHKSRYSGPAIVLTRITNSRWGPHGSPQGDVYLAQNAVNFDGFPPFRTTMHKDFLPNSCATCHMAMTDTNSTSPNKDKVGGHALYLNNPATNYDHLEACKNCHAGKTKFDDFIADQDYDGDAQIEPWRREIDGCDSLLMWDLPPANSYEVSWSLIAADSFNVTLRKSYWNWQLMKNGSERGMHNPKYTIDVLRYSRSALIGIIPVSNEVPQRFELSQNYPNPFNPTTNINFAIAKQSDVTIKIYDLLGREVRTLVNQKMVPGTYKVDWLSDNNEGKSVSSGVYFYRITAGDFTDSKKMILVR